MLFLKPLSSCQIYNVTCGCCNTSHIGKTFGHIKVRVSEHQGVSPQTVKRLKESLSISVRDHMLDSNHKVAWDGSLNKNIYSKEFFLF